MGNWVPVRLDEGRPPDGPVPEGLRDIGFAAPEVVLHKGPAGAWDAYGVRDPSLLTGPDGRLATPDGAMVMYYTGSARKGRSQGCGRAVSQDGGRTWQRAPSAMVFGPGFGGWDSGMATTPYVMRWEDGSYRMYYRGGSRIYDDAIGLAVSRDGVHFERYGDGPILTPREFRDMPQRPPLLMGLPNVVRMLDGRYLLTFEGDSVSRGRCQIFGAVSEDGIRFVPLNDGGPLFSADDVHTWNVDKVANPRITVLEDEGLYLLTFNGSHQSGLYALGFAFSRDLEKWWEHPANPILCPTGLPVRAPFSGRLEGGCLVKEDLADARDGIRMYFMAIPLRGPSHKDGVIGLSVGRRLPDRVGRGYTAVAASPDCHAVTAGEQGSVLGLRRGPGDGLPTRVHVPLARADRVTAVRFEFRFTSIGDRAAFVLGEEMGSLFGGRGLRIMLRGGRLVGSGTWPRRRALRRRFARRAGALFPPFTRRLATVEAGHWHTLVLGREEGEWVVAVGNGRRSLHTMAGEAAMPLADLALVCTAGSLEVRGVEVLRTGASP